MSLRRPSFPGPFIQLAVVFLSVLQAPDAFPPTGGPWELTYAAALGNGATLDEWNRDDNHRQYYWLSFAMPFDKTRGPRWHDVMLYGSFSAMCQIRSKRWRVSVVSVVFTV